MRQGLVILIAAGALGLSGCGFMDTQQDQPRSGQAASVQPTQSFSQVDRDGDNNISRAEAQDAGMDRMVERWSELDRDQDNVLDESEFSAFTESQ